MSMNQTLFETLTIKPFDLTQGSSAGTNYRKQVIKNIRKARA